MTAIVTRGASFDVNVDVPGDKSISHRALILASLAAGVTRLRGLAPGDDVARTLACLRALGVRARHEGEALVVDGVAARFRSPAAALDCGNSGTTLRLLAGVLAGAGTACVLDGDASLRRRPMGRVVAPLSKMGAVIEAVERDGEHFAPVRLEPASGLHGADLAPSAASAQVKGALLLAGLFAEGTTRVTLDAVTRDHTERMLVSLGAPIVIHTPQVAEVQGGGLPLRPAGEFTVPGDPSAATALLVAAALRPGGRARARGVSLATGRTAALDLLRAAGVVVDERSAREHSTGRVADLSAIGPERLASFVLDPTRVPSLIDELPLLAVLATRCEGTTHVRGASELRHKESDRIAGLVVGLRELGADIDEHHDGFSVHGPAELRGGRVDTRGDHRLAIAFSVAAMACRGPIHVDDEACVAVSWPAFFEVLRAAGVDVRKG